MKYKIEMELDEKRGVVVVRFFGENGYPGIEREYSFSNDAYVVRKVDGQLTRELAAWLHRGEVPK